MEKLKGSGMDWSWDALEVQTGDWWTPHCILTSFLEAEPPLADGLAAHDIFLGATEIWSADTPLQPCPSVREEPGVPSAEAGPREAGCRAV